jgi:hypothetical protein
VSRGRPRWRHAAPAALALVLAACAGAPAPPDWQIGARAATDRALAAYLRGDTRVAAAEFARARGEVASTGRADLVARVELLRCAARVASLEFEACAGFEALRSDAPPAERAYADFLAGKVPVPDPGLLPAQQRAAAVAAPAEAAAVLQEISDPLARLVGAGVMLETGRASPAVIALATETASAQGWRRPLLAWLHVQRMRAEQAGDVGEAERVRRRIALVQGEP